MKTATPRGGTALPLARERVPRLEEGTNFAAVLAASKGHEIPLPPPPVFDAPPADLAERVRRALYEVSDPEFPISVLDLGLIYDVRADDTSGVVEVDLSFTATACPCMDFIKWDVRERILEEPAVRQVTIETVWDPPWTTGRISDRGREILREAGVSL